MATVDSNNKEYTPVPEGHEPGFSKRLNELEREASATRSDIRGIYAGLDEIRAVLVRIQEGSKPNINALFVAILMASSVLIAVGGLALAPISQAVDKIYASQERVTDVQQEMLMSRFPALQGQALTASVSDLEGRVSFLEGYTQGRAPNE